MVEQGIGEALRAWRAARGLSQRELAARSGVDYTSIARIETAKQDPTVGLLARLAKALGTTVPALFGEPRASRGRRGMEQPEEGQKRQDRKTANLWIGIAARPKTGYIHIYNRTDGTVLSTVCNKEGIERSHPHLYRQLRAILKPEGKWPLEMEQRETRD